MMSRDLFSFENLHRHYLACRRGKRNTADALRFEARQEEELLALSDALVARSYEPAPSVCFVTQRPKLREIFAADFRDRIVHYLLVRELERTWEPIFIHDSYACRRGKGIHAGVDRLQTFLRQATCNGARRAWTLQLDIRNYFMSIDRELLWQLLAPKIDDDDIRWLARLLVFHDCTQRYVVKSDARLLARVPSHKSLFGAPPGKGLPIGNLNSQFFANVYLNALDQFVKHDLKAHHYLRYCDDFVLVDHDCDQLVEWRARIASFLRERLLLELNPTRERLRPASDGIDFLGYIVRADYRLVRRRVIGNLVQKLRETERALVTTERRWTCYRFDTCVLDRLTAVLASYYGHFAHASSHRLRGALIDRFPWLRQYFGVPAGIPKQVAGAPVPRWRPPPDLPSVARQYRFFRQRFRGDALLFQVGRFFEFYHPHDGALARALGLAGMAPNARGARWGFPLSQGRRRISALVAQGRTVTVVMQTGRSLTGRRERVARWRFVPALWSSER
jgi:hypothetical protein